MRNVFFVFFLWICIFGTAACSGSPAEPANANVAVDANGDPIPVVAEITDAAVALNEGNRLFDTGETEKAIEAYQKAVELDPATAEAYFKMGIAFSLIERRDSYMVSPTPTPLPGETKPEEVKSNSDKAFEKAVEAYKKIVKEEPENDVAYFNLGRSYAKLDDDREAADALRRAAKLKPNDTEYQTELGVMLIRLAKYDEAVRALRKAIDLDPSNSQAEELLERAEAGRKRINYTTLPRDPRDRDGDDDENANTDGNSGTPADDGKKPPTPVKPAPKTTPPPPPPPKKP